MTGNFFFSAVGCLLLTLTLISSVPLVYGLLLFFWCLRCYLLKLPKLFVRYLLTLFVTGSLIFVYHLNKESLLLPNEKNFLVLSDFSTLKINGDRLQFQGEVQTQNGTENVVVFYQLSSEEEKEQWQLKWRSETYAISGKLETPSANKDIHRFDYQQHLKRNHIYWVLAADSIVKVDEREDVFSKAKERILHHIDSSMSGATGVYLKALLVSDKREMNSEVIDSFRKVGLIHLLSISGLHVQMFVKMFTYLLLRVGITKERTNWLIVTLLMIYGELLGWGTSVFRSVVQITFSIISEGKKIGWTSLDCWSMTVVLSLWINPFMIVEAGYQLSYGLSFLLIFLSQSDWFKALSSKQKLGTSSVMIYVFSLPILSFHFFEFPGLSLLLNLIIIPLFGTFFLPLLLCLFALSFFIPKSLVLESLLRESNFLIEIIERGVRHIASFSQLSFVTGRLPWWGMVLLIISIIGMIQAVEKRTQIYKKMFFFSSLLIISLITQRFLPTGNVTIVDVGQGEAIFIKEPFGKKTYLIDTGGLVEFEKEAWRQPEQKRSLADTVVLPFLKSQGVSRLSQVILTHSDTDHTGTLKELAMDLNINEVVATNVTWEDERMKETVSILSEKNIPMKIITSPRTEPTFLGPDLVVLWPVNESNGMNNDSLVLYGKIGSLYWLFTGDIEEETEQELLKTYPRLRTDVLKVAHHGSRTSTTEAFLKTLQPKYALISSGRNNIYGHPHADVLENLKKYEVEVYETANRGNLVFHFYDGKGKFNMNNEKEE